MNELSALESALADLDVQIALSVDYIRLDAYADGRNSNAIVIFSPRLCLMKSDCLKAIAQARVNQLLPEKCP